MTTSPRCVTIFLAPICTRFEAAVGDWTVYYEPRRASGDLSSRGGRQAYIATARIDRIEPDPRRPEHFYAFVSGYLDFARPVPFRESKSPMSVD